MAVETRVVDAAGALRAWVNAQTDLVGKGKPLANGVHLSRPRSTSQGAIGWVQEITPSIVTDGYHDARLSFEVTAVGSEEGARGSALTACKALANTVLDGIRRPATVTTGLGEDVRLLWADPESAQGPSFSGDVTGEALYRWDVTIRCQPG